MTNPIWGWEQIGPNCTSIRFTAPSSRGDVTHSAEMAGNVPAVHQNRGRDSPCKYISRAKKFQAIGGSHFYFSSVQVYILAATMTRVRPWRKERGPQTYNQGIHLLFSKIYPKDASKIDLILDKLISCSVCRSIFDHRHELHQHQIMHEHAYCTQCQNIFKSDEDLARHLQLESRCTSRGVCKQSKTWIIQISSFLSLGNHTNSVR